MVLNYNLVVCSWLTLITGLTSKLQVFVKPVFQLSLPLQLNVCLNVCVKALKWHISRPSTKARRSEHSATFISNWSCFKLITFHWQALTVTAVLPYIVELEFSRICLPHTSITAFLMFLPIFKVFSNLKTWGSHLAMSTDDRFLPQGSATHTLVRVAYM